MIDPRCLGPDIDHSKISPEARISGSSYLTGSQTAVGPDAELIDSRLHNVIVESNTKIIDSICTASGKPHSHRCDAAGRVVVSGCVPAVIGQDAEVIGSTLTNTSVGPRSLVEETSATDCTIGPDNSIRQAKIILTETLARVTVLGPTEISESLLGHGATIDRRGYFEGIFSNAFFQLKFDENGKCLKVVDTIELPHVSRYGTNTINSTNSGKLLPQPDGILKSLGRYGGLWHDPLLSHEQIMLGPCCWVAPWTKVVGQSAEKHQDDESLVNDRLMTYLMPFSIAGVGGELTRGLVMPGELSVGLGPKQRRGAWTFTYAPGAVIAMVARLYAALPDDEKYLTNTIVDKAISTALEMTRAMAAEYNVDLNVSIDEQPRGGWPRWIALTYALLRAHLDNQLWRFENGQPCDWSEKAGRWQHPRFDTIVSLVPDAIENQVDETALFDCNDPLAPLTVAVPTLKLKGLLRPNELCRIDPKAQVDAGATIAPGCRIGPDVVVESGASVWQSVLDDCHIAADAVIERSEIRGSKVGPDSVVRSCRIVDSQMGKNSTAEAASIERSRLAAQATVSAFGQVCDVETDFGAILGAPCRSAKIRTNLMSMHLAGAMDHVEALPTTVVLDEKTVDVPAVPMIGGGAILRGSAEAPIQVECSFIGSNAILEAGVRIGFGCFVLGRLPSGSELLPLTLSTDENLQHHQIGGVLGSLPSTIITHFLSWAFQATGPEMAAAVAELVRQSIQRGIDAVEEEIGQREKKNDVTRMNHYTDRQLDSGLANYRRSLDSGAWDLAWHDGELCFTAEKGNWHERSGTTLWGPRR